MRVCICGTRDWQDEKPIFETLKTLDPSIDVVVHGGARGADEIADRLAVVLGFRVEIVRADWETHGRAAGPVRNRVMIRACDAVYAFWDGKSPGTAHAIKTAKTFGKKITIFTPSIPA